MLDRFQVPIPDRKRPMAVLLGRVGRREAISAPILFLFPLLLLLPLLPLLLLLALHFYFSLLLVLLLPTCVFTSSINISRPSCQVTIIYSAGGLVGSSYKLAT